MADVLSHTALRANILADALTETVADLRLIEPGDMIGYIRGQKWSTIADLVLSCSELSFREGTLVFACMADFQLDWATPPAISLELEFQNNGVSVFFTLYLGRRESWVDIKAVWFGGDPSDQATGTSLLAQALAAARLPAPLRGRPPS